MACALRDQLAPPREQQGGIDFNRIREAGRACLSAHRAPSQSELSMRRASRARSSGVKGSAAKAPSSVGVASARCISAVRRPRSAAASSVAPAVLLDCGVGFLALHKIDRWVFRLAPPALPPPQKSREADRGTTATRRPGWPPAPAAWRWWSAGLPAGQMEMSPRNGGMRWKLRHLRQEPPDLDIRVFARLQAPEQFQDQLFSVQDGGVRLLGRAHPRGQPLPAVDRTERRGCRAHPAGPEWAPGRPPKAIRAGDCAARWAKGPGPWSAAERRPRRAER